MIDVTVRTTRPLKSEEVQKLADRGFRIISVLSPRRYRVKGRGRASTLKRLSFVAGVTDTEAKAKLDRGLKKVAQKAARRPAARGATTASAAARATGAPAEPVSVLCTLDTEDDPKATIRALRTLGKVKKRIGRRALVEVDGSRVGELAALSGILEAEIEPRNETQNDVARGLVACDPVIGDLSLDGSSEIVGVADSGLDTGVNDVSMHPDFAGRIVNLRATVSKAAFGVADAADLNNHGTHVSGSILGSGASSNGNVTGIAPAARITLLSMGPNNSTSLSVPFDLMSGVFQDAYDDGARLHNNSWSSGGSAGAYTAFSLDVDEFVRDNPSMLILFAAGNDGPDVGTVTAPGTAKNCLTVGACESVRPLPATISINPNLQDHDHNPATPDQAVPLSIGSWDLQADNVEHLSDFSGRGPTDDGRIKPDLVAPGTFILSCRSQISTADKGPDGLTHGADLDGFYADDSDGVATHAEAVGTGLPGGPHFGAWAPNTPGMPAGSGAGADQSYFYTQGTSMATPITTGAAAILRQYLREQRGLEPTAALMKAMLVNAARVPAFESTAPNNGRGFGWLDLENTLRPAPTGRQALSDDVDLAVATDDVRSFSVQLADPAHPFRVTLTYTDRQGSGIQNSLYLRVIAPGGAIHDGDTTAFPTVTNNVQRVHIDSPAAGTYTVEVHGVSVLFGIDAHPGETRQDFALAVINGLGFSPNPVDVCQVIDKSGSMGAYGYMDPVKERAKQLVGMMRINDRTGAVAFNHAASNVHDVIPITGFADQTSIQTDIGLLEAGGLTSIGGGLELGLAKLSAGGDAAHPQALVLLSDGHENTPPWVGGGATDSPPAWFAGPDLTEILPTVPAGTRVYTVSLGVQSDEVLLQDIAALTGGTYHGIHSPADIGELHEIYVHLQAAAGGEEVISSGSDAIDSIRAGELTEEELNAGGAVRRATAAGVSAIRNLRPVLADERFERPLVQSKVHTIPVDDSIDSLTLMVSWHDPALPVELSVMSPRGKVYDPRSRAVLTARGEGYRFYRIEEPEPGAWRMRVTPGKRRSRVPLRSHAYTFGAYARTPIGIRVKLPVKRLRLRVLRVGVGLRDVTAVRSKRFQGVANLARATNAKLIAKHRDSLDRLVDNLTNDAPRVDPTLVALGLLDRQERAKGKKSIFVSRKQTLRLTSATSYRARIEVPTRALHLVQFKATGSTRGGYRYLRSVRLNVRT